MKYKILFDYRTEGNKFEDEEFDSVDDAVKHAVALMYGTEFRIVSIHWEPELKKDKEYLLELRNKDMGYAVYWLGNRYGGYGVTSYCEHPDCNKEIDRGISFACGGEPFSEFGCDRYFCDGHMGTLMWNEEEGAKCEHEEDCDCEFHRVCERCEKEEEPFDYKPEHPEWVYHILKHHSWDEWRNNNPEVVKELKKLPKKKPEYWDNKKD